MIFTVICLFLYSLKYHNLLIVKRMKYMSVNPILSSVQNIYTAFSKIKLQGHVIGSLENTAIEQ